MNMPQMRKMKTEEAAASIAYQVGEACLYLRRAIESNREVFEGKFRYRRGFKKFLEQIVEIEDRLDTLRYDIEAVGE